MGHRPARPTQGLCSGHSFRPAPAVALPVLRGATSTRLGAAQEKTSFLSNCCAQVSSGSAFSQMLGGAHLCSLGWWQGLQVVRRGRGGGGASHQSVPQVVQEKDGGNKSSSVSALTAVWKGRDNLSRSPRGRFCTSCWGEVGIWTEGSMRASGGRGAGRGVVCAHRNLPALEFQSDQRGWQAEPPALMIFRSTHHHWGFS